MKEDRYVVAEPWVDKLRLSKYRRGVEREALIVAAKELSLTGYNVRVVGKKMFGLLLLATRKAPGGLRVLAVTQDITNGAIEGTESDPNGLEAKASFLFRNAEEASTFLRDWLMREEDGSE